MKIISEQHSYQEKSNHNYNHTFNNSSPTYTPLLSPTEKLLHQEHTTTFEYQYQNLSTSTFPNTTNNANAENFQFS